MHVQRIPLDQISPGRFQARRHFAPEALAELAESLRSIGLVQPIVLRPLAVCRYELLAGERRWRAAQLAGLTHLEAILRPDLSDPEAEVLGLVENLQRDALSPIETAQALQRLSRLGHTHAQIAEQIGKTRVYVSHHLGLLTLIPALQAEIDHGQLSLGHAKVLTGLASDQQAVWVGVAQRLTVRQLEQRLRRAKAETSAHDGDIGQLGRALSDHFGLPIVLEAEGQGGHLHLRFHSLEELEGLLERWGYRGEP